MAYSSFDTKEINAKVLYVGPKGSGKSENLRAIVNELRNIDDPAQHIVSVDSSNQYFEFLPVHIGKIKDFDIRVHLYTLPPEDLLTDLSQVIWKGIDGIVFVADSRLSAVTDNFESMNQLDASLSKQGLTKTKVPMVIQYNQRDDQFAMPVKVLREELNTTGSPEVESVASQRKGTMETLESITKLVLAKMGNMQYS